MSNSVQGTSGVENVKPVAQEAVDTPMDSPGSVGKGKGKMAEEMPIDESEDSGEEEGEGEVEEPDEDNMEEIDTENIVNSRTRGKNIDYAEAAKQMEGDDDDEEEDEDFHAEDEEMRDD